MQNENSRWFSDKPAVFFKGVTREHFKDVKYTYI